MSSLYRCRARVGYKPFKSDKIILFDERQIQELNVKLKWNNTLPAVAAQGAGTADGYASGLNQSQCQVTISDPYLTGIAWPALFDAASMYSASNMARMNNIILPPCEEGQDPLVDKCHRYVSIDESGLVASDGSTKQVTDSMAHLLVSLFYDINGTRFGTDYYFRVSRMSVSHGSNFPSVTIGGVDARAIIFNQNLINVKFEEGMTVDDALKKISEESGFRANFCVAPDGEEKKPYIIPHTLIYKGVTPEEAFRKILKASGGSMLHLPIKEQAKNISVCSRGEVFQGCTVFYLGKGLYESYQINGEPPTTMLESTMQDGSEVNNANPYVSTSFSAEKYEIKTVIESKSKKALEKANKIAFPKLFEACETRCQGPLSTGTGWKGAGPSVENKQYTQTNLYGIAPTGTKAISYLSGKVQSASKDEGKVVIKTDFWFQICKSDESEKCFGRYIYQESNNLSDVKVGIADTLTINQEIGSSTDEKKELVRFYINGHDNKQITIDPQLVWKFANPTEAIREISTTNPPSSSPQSQPAPGEVTIGRVGSTGSSSGPHLHAQWTDGRPITADQVKEFVKVPGTVTSPYNDPSRSRHLGVDIAGNDRAPISIINGASVASVGESKCTTENVRSDGCGGGFGNFVTINTPKGQMILAHLAPQSIPPNLPGLSSSSSGGKTSPTAATGPTTTALTIETAFKGVPRALRITPGRTILSFVTDYDKWIDNDGHKGRDNSTDPGIWIPERFRNWFVKEVDFQWRQGDLRVSIEGNNAWGTTRITAPTFYEYVNAQTTTGEFKMTKDYYGYIRSAGPLCFPLYDEKTGKYEDSCAKNCKEAQDLVNAISASGGGGANGSTSGSFPQANCRTGSANKDEVINALYSVGVNTKNAFAGVLGNFQAESGIQANRHNLANPGSGCSSTSGGPLGSVGYGIAQWCGSRQANIFNKCGRNSNLSCEMQFMVQEIREGKDVDPNVVNALNSASSPSAAADIWNQFYERGPGGIQKRRDEAERIVSQIKCDKP